MRDPKVVMGGQDISETVSSTVINSGRTSGKSKNKGNAPKEVPHVEMEESTGKPAEPVDATKIMRANPPNKKRCEKHPHEYVSINQQGEVVRPGSAGVVLKLCRNCYARW